MKCRNCQTKLEQVVVDLVASPLSNAFLSVEDLNSVEAYYPLKVFVCQECWLMQLEEYKSAHDIFDSNYAYFSSYSASWLEHARSYVQMICDRLQLDGNSQVIEIASNDGYLLQYFQERNVPVLGIEPAANVAKVAKSKGIETWVEYFGISLGEKLVRENKTADLVLGNNVFAHVPDLHDFIGGIKRALKPNGVLTLEFPHVVRLIKEGQFDTIYHEHFSYLSLTTTQSLLEKHGLALFDVEQIPTHGGSIRIFACHHGSALHQKSPAVKALLAEENDLGVTRQGFYQTLQAQAEETKNNLLRFLLDAKREGRVVAAYGAAAKGNTLLNYCGIKNDLITYVVDRSKHKQGMFLPGSHIPVLPESLLRETRPDYILLLPWNIRSELENQLNYVREWGAKLVVAIPKIEVF